MIKSLQDFVEQKKKLPKHLSYDTINQIRNSLQGLQLLVIGTNKDLGAITSVLQKFLVEKQAKPGQHSPIEIIIPAGPTGMDSSQIDIFQALKIPTKVAKNQLEITTATKILAVDQKITLSEINLMKRFNIRPFKHKVNVKKIMLNGKLYGEEILKITDDYMKQKLELGIKNLLSVSLATGVTIPQTAPYVVANAFRNICGLSLATNVLMKYTQNMQAAASAPAAESKKEEKKDKGKKEEKPKEEKKVEEEDDEDVGFGDLF